MRYDVYRYILINYSYTAAGRRMQISPKLFY
jgi:hypothetical protein